jgi:hypothetical protein
MALLRWTILRCRRASVPLPTNAAWCGVQDTLLAFGQLVVNEQENVRRVQLANEYLNSAALAGADGSSMPKELTR